jgi:hypothetical protein
MKSSPPIGKKPKTLSNQTLPEQQLSGKSGTVDNILIINKIVVFLAEKVGKSLKKLLTTWGGCILINQDFGKTKLLPLLLLLK